MADNEEEIKQTSMTKKQIDIKALLADLLMAAKKDPKKSLITLSIILVVLISLRLFIFNSSSDSGKKIFVSADEGEVTLNISSSIAYVTINSGKSTEFMATINEEDKILTFAAVLGIEKEDLRFDVESNMAPILSETLRFFSDKTKDQILEIIRDEEGKDRGRLLFNLNRLLEQRGVNLETKGMIVSISFTRYFFPPL